MTNKDNNLKFDIYYKILTDDNGACRLEFYYGLKSDNKNNKGLDLSPYLIATQKSKDNITLNSAKALKNKIRQLIGECLILKNRAYITPDSYIIGSAPNLILCFDKDKIDFFKGDIYYLLQQLKPIMYFEDLRTLKNGEVWTTVKQPIQWLMALSNAAGFLDFDENSSVLTDNPKLILNQEDNHKQKR